jgi:glutaredoxin 3
MSEVTVYTTEPCSFCARAKGLLKAHGVEFAEVNLARDPAGRMELAQRTGMMTFPQVIVDGELLGGFSEVQAAAESGRLDDLSAGSGTGAERLSPGSAGSGTGAQRLSPGSAGPGTGAQRLSPGSAA